MKTLFIYFAVKSQGAFGSLQRFMIHHCFPMVSSIGKCSTPEFLWKRLWMEHFFKKVSKIVVFFFSLEFTLGAK